MTLAQRALNANTNPAANGWDGAPHSHLLPCHSLSHKDLKSPCAEQESKAGMPSAITSGLVSSPACDELILGPFPPVIGSQLRAGASSVLCSTFPSQARLVNCVCGRVCLHGQIAFL